MVSSLFKTVATGFGLGYSPVFPGTLGSLLGIPLFLFLSPFDGSLYFLTVLAFTFLSIWIINKALPSFLDTKRPTDPRCIVLDEVAGYLWSAGVLQHLGFWFPRQGVWSFLILSFFFFRLFDIRKCWPVGWVERRYKGAVGIVLDDVVAGILAGIVGILFCFIYPFIVHLFVSL